jgi:hypothetical protein
VCVYIYNVSVHHTSYAWLKRVISHRYENDVCGKLARGHHVVTLHNTKKDDSQYIYTLCQALLPSFRSFKLIIQVSLTRHI